jgi:beta-lactamase class A
LLSPNSGYGGWIGTQLPASVQAAVRHKAGWIPASEGGSNTNNEIAIVQTLSGKNYVVAIATEKSDTFAHANSVVEYLSCVVYKLMDNPGSTVVTGCTLGATAKVML